MSYSIEGQNYWDNTGPVTHESDEDLLRREHGWDGVASGLAGILISYGVMAVIGVLAGALFLYIMMHADPRNPRSFTSNITHLWVLYAGMGIISVLSLFSYALILINKWRCAIHAPDRHGAKWFIFGCCCCLIVGPLVGVASGISVYIQGDDLTPRQIEELRASPEDVTDQVLLPMAQTIQVAHFISMVVSLAMMVFFVLFLRAIGTCFSDSRLTALADMYLTYHIVLTCFTVYQVFFQSVEQLPPFLALVLLLGWLASALWYVGLIFYTRLLILKRISELTSPLDAPV